MDNFTVSNSNSSTSWMVVRWRANSLTRLRRAVDAWIIQVKKKKNHHKIAHHSEILYTLGYIFENSKCKFPRKLFYWWRTWLIHFKWRWFDLWEWNALGEFRSLWRNHFDDWKNYPQIAKVTRQRTIEKIMKKGLMSEAVYLEINKRSHRSQPSIRHCHRVRVTNKAFFRTHPDRIGSFKSNIAGHKINFRRPFSFPNRTGPACGHKAR